MKKIYIYVIIVIKSLVHLFSPDIIPVNDGIIFNRLIIREGTQIKFN